ncbi:DUF1330 domain-containing protein [Sinorhizobium meliloti]|uniref:DUF1330 domain-containing protein n=1 Tax=Rhizobium meliloti TaxID=382 RepID=UPI000FDB6508|nr:DUF1330 domain-containing protein [Sinorhizobium meliloti]
MVRGGEVEDADALKAYNDIFASVATRYGAEVVAGRNRVETVEGPHFPRQLILSFESYQAAKACYADPDYQASLALAERAYRRELSILEG